MVLSVSDCHDFGRNFNGRFGNYERWRKSLILGSILSLKKTTSSGQHRSKTRWKGNRRRGCCHGVLDGCDDRSVMSRERV
jgi:hypothetical protein